MHQRTEDDWMEITQKFSDDANKFLCKSGLEIDILLVNDLVSDCEPENDDEFILASQAEGFKFLCSVEGKLPWFNGHNKCYNISEICTYKLNHFRHLIPCRTDQHLVSCENYECNMTYKCPGVPWAYVCGGKWDCPSCYDEYPEQTCGQFRICSLMFKCKNSQSCIHLDDVCNRQKDCRAGDDKYICSLKNNLCPSLCTCLLLESAVIVWKNT